jgi:HK97 family phage portal protein
MGLLQNIGSKLFPKVSKGSTLDEYVVRQLMSMNIAPDYSGSTYLNSYTGNGDVFTVINKITEPASTVPIYQYDRNDEEVEGKMITLLKNPNPYMSINELIEAALSFYLLFGDCYTSFEKVPNGLNANLPLRLDILPPQWMTIVIGSYLDPVAGYKFEFGTNQIDYPKEQIMHWKEFNPDWDAQGGHLKGMSRLKPIIKSVTGSSSGYDALVSSFQHMGAVGLLTLMGEGGKKAGLTKPQLSAIKQQFKDEYTGPKNAGRIAITDWDHKWTNFGLTPVEMNILASLGSFKGAICDAYNVPSMLLSGSQDRTYSNYQEALRALWTAAIKPSLDAYIDKLSRWLGPLFGEEDTYLQADYSGIDVLQKDTAAMVAWMVLGKCFTKNEIREAAGYEALPDPAMDIVYESAGTSPVGDLGMLPEAPLTEEVMKALRIPDYRKHAVTN